MTSLWSEDVTKTDSSGEGRDIKIKAAMMTCFHLLGTGDSFKLIILIFMCLRGGQLHVFN